MTRVFIGFNQEGPACPICRTHEDIPCILVPIPGTIEDNIQEAHAIHLKCARLVANEYAWIVTTHIDPKLFDED